MHVTAIVFLMDKTFIHFCCFYLEQKYSAISVLLCFGGLLSMQQRSTIIQRLLNLRYLCSRRSMQNAAFKLNMTLKIARAVKQGCRIDLTLQFRI